MRFLEQPFSSSACVGAMVVTGESPEAKQNGNWNVCVVIVYLSKLTQRGQWHVCEFTRWRLDSPTPLPRMKSKQFPPVFLSLLFSSLPPKTTKDADPIGCRDLEGTSPCVDTSKVLSLSGMVPQHDLWPTMALDAGAAVPGHFAWPFCFHFHSCSNFSFPCFPQLPVGHVGAPLGHKR